MKLKVFDLRMSAGEGSFESSEMEDFLEDKVVLSVTDHFFVHEESPHLLVLITYREEEVKDKRSRGSRRRQDWRSELTEEEVVVFDGIRAWRAERAREEGVPPYLILTNRQLADIVRQRPGSLTALREIQGVGQVTCDKYGAALLECLQQASPTSEEEFSPRKEEQLSATNEESSSFGSSAPEEECSSA
jgi:superfamily II DNA helicase RecQ